MAPIFLHNGGILLRNGMIAVNQNCCCDCCKTTASGQSITVLAEGVEYVLTFATFGNLVSAFFNIPIIDTNTNMPIFDTWIVSLICENGAWNASILGPCFAPTFCAPQASATLSKDDITCLPSAGIISWSGDINNCNNWPANYDPAPFPSVEIL